MNTAPEIPSGILPMRERSHIAEPAIDCLEEAWWDQNAETVESIWALPYTIRLAVRSHYMTRAKQFFLKSDGNGPISVLEVGCGSGWVGRLIAEPEIVKIIGIDLSEQQINLARRNASKDNLDGTCEYYCQNLADFTVSENNDVSCVLIHAILHHLSWQEIHIVLSQIASLGRGTRVFIYEPVYLETENPSSALYNRIRRRVAFHLVNLPSKLSRFVLKGQDRYFNQSLNKRVQSMCEHSQQNGWVLSPKEVVFQEKELLATLNQYFDINDRYLCNHTSLAIGQVAAMYDDANVQRRFCRTVLPLSRWIDHLLFKMDAIAHVTNGYVFMGYHCVVK